jgi:hypothetical protein
MPEHDDAEDPGDAPMMDLLAAVDRYGRRVRARRANLIASGKSPEEVQANVETTLRPAAAAAIVAAIESAEGAGLSVAGGYTDPVTTTTAVSE